MMGVMEKCFVAAAGLLATSIGGLAVSTYLYAWPGIAQAPRWLPEPKAEGLVVPAYPVTVRTVEMKRGETLVQALSRGGLPPRTATQLATQLGKNGADLRKIRAGATIEITWNSRNEATKVRYEASSWLSFAARPVDSGWRVGRAETVPEVRVEAVSGVVQRSLFDAVERTGESARLVLGLVDIFSSDFDLTADTRVGDKFRLLVEKRYAGETFVDYGRILIAQYASGRTTLTGVGFEPQASRFAHYDLSGQSLRKSFLKSPLEFTRVTSGFTYARPHPILGGVRPHLTGRATRPSTTTCRGSPRTFGPARRFGKSRSSATSGPPGWRRDRTSTTASCTTGGS
jgi:murein DD-endopeptidase MepM/ murein hydrolase activator NlpD